MSDDSPATLNDLEVLRTQLNSLPPYITSEIAQLLAFQKALDNSRKQNLENMIPEVTEIVSFESVAMVHSDYDFKTCQYYESGSSFLKEHLAKFNSETIDQINRCIGSQTQ